MAKYHGYLAFQRRGVVTFPPDLRERLRGDEPGAQLEVTETEPGVFEMRAVVPVPADQRWFWTERWQRMEREADDDVAAGRVRRYDSAKEFLADLER
jgi:bifunctional DNA-binding transcriptional regulator/antitoxin component of YhaV-PrlF toxin-antitoxin module